MYLSNICLFVCICFYQITYTLQARDYFRLGLKEDSENKPHNLCYACTVREDRLSRVFGNASTYTKIYLYSRETGYNYTELVFENSTTIRESVFDAKKITKVLIHGWRGSGFTVFEDTLRTTYLYAQDLNLLEVDWSQEAYQLNDRAKASVVPVGIFVAHFLDWLVTETNVSVGDIHIVGHSLGAHVAGVVGEHISTGPIGRITGLDPAGPGFSNSSTSGRLDSSDAQFVDVIHTCAPYAGFYDACGHVDFYPNKGEPPQPGCQEILVCSHIRSYEYFNESITSDQFISTPCNSWRDFKDGLCNENTTTVMGENVNLSARGKFYLRTSGSYPFALDGNSPCQARIQKIKI